MFKSKKITWFFAALFAVAIVFGGFAQIQKTQFDAGFVLSQTAAIAEETEQNSAQTPAGENNGENAPENGQNQEPIQPQPNQETGSTPVDDQNPQPAGSFDVTPADPTEVGNFDVNNWSRRGSVLPVKENFDDFTSDWTQAPSYHEVSQWIDYGKYRGSKTVYDYAKNPYDLWFYTIAIDNYNSSTHTLNYVSITYEAPPPEYYVWDDGMNIYDLAMADQYWDLQNDYEEVWWFDEDQGRDRPTRKYYYSGYNSAQNGWITVTYTREEMQENGWYAFRFVHFGGHGNNYKVVVDVDPVPVMPEPEPEQPVYSNPESEITTGTKAVLYMDNPAQWYRTDYIGNSYTLKTDTEYLRTGPYGSEYLEGGGCKQQIDHPSGSGYTWERVEPGWGRYITGWEDGGGYSTDSYGSQGTIHGYEPFIYDQGQRLHESTEWTYWTQMYTRCNYLKRSFIYYVPNSTSGIYVETVITDLFAMMDCGSRLPNMGERAGAWYFDGNYNGVIDEEELVETNKVPSTLQVNDNTWNRYSSANNDCAYLKVYWVDDKPKEYDITWYAGGGIFPDSDEDGGKIKTITSTLGSPYVFPAENPVWLGYELKGWFYTDLVTYEIVPVDENTIFNDSKYDEVWPIWELKQGLTLNITRDNGVDNFDVSYLKASEIAGRDGENGEENQITGYTNTTMNGGTEITLTMRFEDGYSVHGLEFTKSDESEAELGTDYIYITNLMMGTGTKVVKFKMFASLNVEIQSNVAITVIAVSNYTGQFVEDGFGGDVSIGGTAWGSRVSQSIAFGADVSGITVRPNAEFTGEKQATFLGFYTEFSYDGVRGKTPLGTSDTLNLTAVDGSRDIYAVFEFARCDVTVTAYTSDNNFKNVTAATLTSSANGGWVDITFAANGTTGLGYSASVSENVIKGHDFTLKAKTQFISSAGERYRFVGFYKSLDALIRDETNNGSGILNFDDESSRDAATTTIPLTETAESICYYAKFIKEYKFELVLPNEGVTSVALGTESNKSKYYYPGQKLDGFSYVVDDNFVANGWEVVEGPFDDQENVLGNRAVTANSFEMPTNSVKLKPKVDYAFLGLTVNVMFKSGDRITKTTTGGTAKIITTNIEQIDENRANFQNNIYTADSPSLTTSVQYRSSAVSLGAESRTTGNHYAFVGWYTDENCTDRVDRDEDNGVFHINSMQEAVTYYCLFTEAFAIDIVLDTEGRVSNVTFDYGLEQTQSTESGINKYTAYAYEGAKVRFEVELHTGYLDGFPTANGVTLDIRSPRDKTYEFDMPGQNVEIRLATAANQHYNVQIRAIGIDNMQAYDITAEADQSKKLGEVRFSNYPSAEVVSIEQGQTVGLIAREITNNYGSFLGWFKLRNEVSYTDLLVPGKVSYYTPVEDWLNVYDEINNPNGAYKKMNGTIRNGDSYSLTSEEVEHEIKPIVYVAVFVKKYTVNLSAGDGGIEAFTFSDNTTTQTQLLPYGTEVFVKATSKDGYNFSHYSIMDGTACLGEYNVQNNKILATDENLHVDNDYLLSFRVYDKITLSAHTVTTMQSASVEIYTVKEDGTFEQSNAGGTFAGLSATTGTVELPIGATISAFVAANPGYVFSHFEVSGDHRVSPNYVWTQNTTNLKVYFTRNSYLFDVKVYSKTPNNLITKEDTNNDSGSVTFDAGRNIVLGTSNQFEVIANNGYRLVGVYKDTSWEEGSLLSERPDHVEDENHAFHYIYSTEALETVPSNLEMAYQYYALFETLDFAFSTELVVKDLNSGATTTIQNSALLNVTASEEGRLKYSDEITITINENGDDQYRYFYGYTLTVEDIVTGNEIPCTLITPSSEPSSFGCLAQKIEYKFNMPYANVHIKLVATYYQMNLKFKKNTPGSNAQESTDAEWQNVKGSNGETFVGEEVEMTVKYNDNKYSASENINVSNQVGGVTMPMPYAKRKGYNLTEFNTSPDGTGTTVVEFTYIDNTLTGVRVFDFELSGNSFNYNSPVTLYPIYEYAKIELYLDFTTDNDGTYSYTGDFQKVLKAEISNYNSSIPYQYTWSTSTIILSNEDYIKNEIEGDKEVSYLKLRSVGQSGGYTCTVNIQGNTSSAVNETKNVTIAKQVITFNLGNKHFYGSKTLELMTIYEENGGLLTGHEIDASSKIIMNQAGEYNNAAQPTMNWEIKLQNGATSQDDFPLTSNYDCQFAGSCTIHALNGLVQVNAGVYKRTINTNNFDDMIEKGMVTDGFSAISMNYAPFRTENDEPLTDGVYSAYFENILDNFNQELTLTFSAPSNYRFYGIKINNEDQLWREVNSFSDPREYIIEKDNYNKETTRIVKIYLRYDYVVNNNKIDIKLLVSNQGLIEVYENKIDQAQNVVDDSLTRQHIVTFSTVFAYYTENPLQQSNYDFKGWYYDSLFTNEVNTKNIWTDVHTKQIYAKWALSATSMNSLVSLVVQDNGVSQTFSNQCYTKIYDGNCVSLHHSLDVAHVTTRAFWYKKDASGNWKQLSHNAQSNIKDCVDQGDYTFKLEIDDNMYGTSVIINDISGNNVIEALAINVIINQKQLTSADLAPGQNFDKIYDGTKAFGGVIGGVIINTGVGSEQLLWQGEYESPDVRMGANSQPESVAINRTGIVAVQDSNAKVENYSFGEDLETLSGVISPYSYTYTLSPSIATSKIYDGKILEIIDSKNVSPSSGHTDKLSFTLKTSAAYAGTYNATDGLFLINTSGSNLINNYNVTLASGTTLTINKASHDSKIKFSGDITVFDATLHILQATLGNNQDQVVTSSTVQDGTYIYSNQIGKLVEISTNDEVISNCLPEGTISYKYYKIVNAGVEPTETDFVDYNGVIRAGTYLVKATISASQNYEEWNGEATLIINQRGFSVDYKYGNNDVEQYYAYTGANQYSNFRIESDLDPQDSELIAALNLGLEIRQNDVVVTDVTDIGQYTIFPTYNEADFKLNSEPHTFTIVTKTIYARDIVLSTTQTYTYNKNDRRNEVLAQVEADAEGTIYEDVFEYAIASIGKEIVSGSNAFAATTSLTNAGRYQVNIQLTVKSDKQDSYKFLSGTQTTASVIVDINKYVLTTDNFNVSEFTKTYDGTTEFKNKAAFSSLNVDFGDSESISGYFDSKNVGDRTVVDFTLDQNAENYDAETHKTAILSTIQAEIVKKEVRINLPSADAADKLTAYYKEDYSFQINQNSYQKYVSGMIQGEYLVADVVCQTGNPDFEGSYFYGLTTSNLGSGNYALLNMATAKVVANDEEESLDNYDITVWTGGITLVKGQKISVQVQNSENNIYSATRKEIFVDFNNIPAKYNFEAGCFEPVDTTQHLPVDTIYLYDSDPATPLTVTSLFIDAGSYDMHFAMLSTLQFDGFLGGEGNASGEGDIMTLTKQDCYHITPYELESEIDAEVDYKEQLAAITASKQGLGPHSIEYIVTVPNTTAYLPDSRHEFLSTAANPSITATITNTDSYANNYTLSVTLRITTNYKTLSVVAPEYPNAVYTGADHLPTYKAIVPTFKSDGDDYTNMTKENGEKEYSIKYYYNTNNYTEKIINAGVYTVKLVAENYLFVVEGAEPQPTITLGSFEIEKGIITPVYVGEESLVFNNAYRQPARFNFTFGDNDVKDVIYDVAYFKEEALGSQLNHGIKDVGGYVAEVTLRDGQNPNYKFDDSTPNNTQNITITRYTFSVPQPGANDIWFAKQELAADPLMRKQFSTEFGTNLTIEFRRATGEDVGRYSLTNPTIVENGDNYAVAGDFVDQCGAFEILSNKGLFSNLYLKMKDNISIVYDGQYHTTFQLTDYADKFEILDSSGNAYSGNYDLQEVVCGFDRDENNNPIDQIRNVGAYKFKILSINSNTHFVEQVLLNDNGKRFQITAKELRATFSTVQKDYDGSTEAPIANCYEFVDACQSDLDDGSIYLVGEFANAYAGTNKSIALSLQGASAQNYSFTEAAPAQGNILQRKLTATGDFVKVYDSERSSSASITLSGLPGQVGILPGDDVTATAEFESEDVGKDIQITITLNNSNYVIEGAHFGEITPKQLDYNSEKTYSKEYDGSADGPITSANWSSWITGVISGDNIALRTSTYVNQNTNLADPEVGEKYLLVEFEGDDAQNYSIGVQETRISKRKITIVYHYGDTLEYQFEFENDGQAIVKPSGFPANHIVAFDENIDTGNSSAYNFLAEPTRVGYSFKDWTIDVDWRTNPQHTVFTSKQSPAGVHDIAYYNENNSELHLYAKWEKEYYWIWVSAWTENNHSYDKSAAGGLPQINNNDNSNGQQEIGISLEYFTEFTVSGSANSHYEFAGIVQNSGTGVDLDDDDTVLVLNQSNQYVGQVLAETRFFVKFNASNLNLTINLGDTVGVIWSEESVWTQSANTLTATGKFGTSIRLPELAAYGYDFMGYVVQNAQTNVEEQGEEPAAPVPTHFAEELYYLNEANFGNENRKVLMAIFAPKVLTIQIDTNGGTIVGTYDNPTYDSANSTIQVAFNAEIPALPTLEKSGYELSSWTFFEGIDEMPEIDLNGQVRPILTTAQLNLRVVANWNKLQNKFKIVAEIDTSRYSGQEYELFDSCKFKNSYNLGTTTSYSPIDEATGVFTAYTESVVKIASQTTFNNTYELAYWMIGEEMLSMDNGNSTLTQNGATFNLVEESGLPILQVSGFTWGQDNPEAIPSIKAVYAPIVYVIEIDNQTPSYGSMTVTTGALGNDSGYIFAGSIVELSYTENNGYFLADTTVSATTTPGKIGIRQRNSTTGKIVLSNIKELLDDGIKTITVSPKFEKKTFGVDIVEQGYLGALNNLRTSYGIDSIEYLIIDNNSPEYSTFDRNIRSNIQIQTENILKLRVKVNYGYLITHQANKPLSFECQELAPEGNIKVYEYTISDFYEDFTVTFTMEKQNFTVAAGIKLKTLSPGGDVTYTDFPDQDFHTCTITNSDGQAVTEVKMDDRVFYNVLTGKTHIVTIDDETIEYENYIFIGWHFLQTGVMEMCVTTQEYDLVVKQDITLFAVFEIRTFKVQFNVADLDGVLPGTVQNGATGNTILESEALDAGSTYVQSIRAMPNAGYKFDHWERVITYVDADAHTVITPNIAGATQEINFAEMHANIVYTAHFAKRPITLVATAKIESVDGATLGDGNDEKTKVRIIIPGDDEQMIAPVISMNKNALATERISFEAIAFSGYEFVRWEIYPLNENYPMERSGAIENGTLNELTGEITNITSITDPMSCAFFATEDNVTYTVNAIFRLATVDVSVTYVADIQASGQITPTDNNGRHNGNAYDYVFTTKIGNTLNFDLTIMKGFTLRDGTGEEAYSAVPGMAETIVSVNYTQVALSSAEGQHYSSKYSFTITGFDSNTHIYIFGEPSKIELKFAKLDVFKGSANNSEYTEDAFRGYVQYYGQEITLYSVQSGSVAPTLTPTFENCEFIGWSVSTSAAGLVTNAQGQLEAAWTNLSANINLYPIFKFAKVGVVVSISPISAVANAGNFTENVFASVAKNKYTFSASTKEYYFDLGVTFGLNIPVFMNGYSFKCFTYYKVNASNNIEKVEVSYASSTITLDSQELFEIPDTNTFAYSLANNWEEYRNILVSNNNGEEIQLQDNTMYITIECNMSIGLNVENYFTDNCALGDVGSLEINTDEPTTALILSASYNQTITLTATPADGYEIKEWRANSRIIENYRRISVDGQKETYALDYVMIAPTTFTVVFIGKQVRIVFENTKNEIVNARIARGNPAIDADNPTAIIRHVGDSIDIFADANEGYVMSPQWILGRNNSRIGTTYNISSADGALGELVLKPICEEKSVTVYFVLPNGLGSVTNGKTKLSSTSTSTQARYYYTMKYFDQINVQIVPTQRYVVSNISLLRDVDEDYSGTNMTTFLADGAFRMTSEEYNNASNLTFTVDLEKAYWYDMIEEKHLVEGIGMEKRLVQDFEGSGVENDPYLIQSITDLVKLAYVINGGLIQTSASGKNAYNMPTTYYRITGSLDLSEKYWTPIGTRDNPVNCTMIFYTKPVNVLADRHDKYFDEVMFDGNVVSQYSGLFGYLGPDANIQFKLQTNFLLYVLIGVIAVMLVGVVVAIIVVQRMRKGKIRNFDENNRFLFDRD